MNIKVLLLSLACAAAFSAVAGPSAALAVETPAPAAAGKPELLYSIAKGAEKDQMQWHTENGKPEPGHLQGPGAVVALGEDLRLFADTLNFRLVLRRASNGRVVKVFDLAAPAGTALAFKPLITGLASADGRTAYAADEANMAVWKLSFGKNRRDPEMKVESVISLKGALKQMGPIFADAAGNFYIADIPGQRTLLFGPDGAKKFSFEGLTNGVPDMDGLLYHPMYYGDQAVRDIEIFDQKGRMKGFHGRLDFDRTICYIAPVGFDGDGTLYILAASDRKGPLVARIFKKDKKQAVTEFELPKSPVVADKPCWIGENGAVEWAGYEGNSIKVFRLALQAPQKEEKK